MKELKAIIAVIFLFIAILASGQEKTAYGVRYNSKNLSFENDSCMSDTARGFARTELSVSGFMSGGQGQENYGIDFQYRRQHKVLGYGLNFDLENNSEVGALSSASVFIGSRIGKTVSLDFDILGGYGQIIEKIEQKSAIDSASYKLTAWKPFVGTKARINIPISKTIALSLYGEYRYYFCGNSDHSLDPQGVWEIVSQKQYTKRWYAGLGLNCYFNGGQISGDSCWTINPYGGISNTGTIVGMKAVHYNRCAPFMGTIFGVGSEYAFKDGKAKNEVYGLAGLRLIPWGATSRISFDIYSSVGVGQYDNAIKSSTKVTLDDGSPRYKMESQTLDLGVNGKLHAGINFGSGAFRCSLSGFWGYWFSPKTKYHNKGVQLGYNGTDGKTNGSLYGGLVTLGFTL